MPKGAQLRETHELFGSDLVSELAKKAKMESVRFEQPDIRPDEVYGQKERGYTSAAQKLHALMQARARLGYMPGQKADLDRLYALAAVELKLSPSSLRSFFFKLNHVQRLQIEKDIQPVAVESTTSFVAVCEEEMPQASTSSVEVAPEPQPEETDETVFERRLRALAAASVQLRQQGSTRGVTAVALATAAAPAMGLTAGSARIFIYALLPEQRELLGLRIHEK